ncbi:MAG: RNA polymerase sigma factor [Planctomycetota bacterium]
MDRALLASLLEEHGQELRRFVLGVVRDRHLADDVLQATFAKALEKGHSVREGTWKGWIFKVAFHEALLIRRKATAEKRGHEHLRDILEARHSGPKDPLIDVETVHRMRDALARLPEEQRAVVAMRIFDGKSFATIASELKVPLGTVLTRMRLALQKLRSRLQAGE